MSKVDIERLTNLARGCYDAIKDRLEEIARLEDQLSTLEGDTCNGREYWRDQAHPTKTPKLYILHSIDGSCPLHGTPANGERLRVYVGSVEENIAAARAAMDRETKRATLQAKLDVINHGLLKSAWILADFYRSLGYMINHYGSIREA